MEIKKCATQKLPEWTKRCPFQIKGIAIKEAHNAFFKAKGQPRFRSRKNPVQSCFIASSAIKAEGIYPRVSGKGLHYSEPLPESRKDSRLIWKAGKFYIALPTCWREPSRMTQAGRQKQRRMRLAAARMRDQKSRG